ncbi:hypothetical protein CEXT_375091 [Caerostris extrusa]|uniref:Uncharacterized protein n=1 Tax=Caerostris extrusa TaxID=172846 RepID=A0AAV4UAU9_CAEEX|nr:hypothetical protein CEXT_375091 [Caerostris extrusa]
MDKQRFVTNLFTNLYFSWNAAGELEIPYVPHYVPEEDVSVCFLSVVFDFFETLQSGILEGVRRAPDVYFWTECLFPTFAYSVCLRLKSSSDINSLLLVGVFLVNSAYYGVYLKCYRLFNVIPAVFLKFFTNNVTAEFSEEVYFENLKLFCHSFKSNQYLRDLITTKGLRLIEKAIRNEVAAIMVRHGPYITLEDVIKSEFGPGLECPLPGPCTICLTNCIANLNNIFANLMLNGLTST